MTPAVTSCHHPRNATWAPRPLQGRTGERDNRSVRITRRAQTPGSDGDEEMETIRAVLRTVAALLAQGDEAHPWEARLGRITGSGSTAGRGHHNPLPEALSDREMQVLRYLPTHLSTSDIASELYISLNTAKTHLRHIYTKLGVNSRKDAVEQARLARLLAP
jgi:ATP/maltotriose-dependent transcriptional regulator MalT